jgi:O-antigen/teichoic acid export membrane protein
MWKRLTARAAAGNVDFFALLLARGVQLVNSLAISVAVVWAYGLASAGVLTLSSLPSLLGAMAVAFGLPSALPRMAGGGGAKASVGLIVSCASLVPVALGIAIYALGFGRSRAEIISIIAIALSNSLIGLVNIQQMLYVIQGKTHWSPFVPLIHLLGTGAAMLAPNFEQFALTLLAFRAFGSAVGFAPLEYARPEAGQALRAVREASRFAPLDVAGLLSEQLPVAFLSVLLSRTDLGLYGLLRQFVTVAETPGWSHVLSHYPKLTDDLIKHGSSVAQSHQRIAWLSATAVLGAASTMAIAVYKVPSILPAIPIVLATVPARYINNFCDQALRAAGMFRDCFLLTLQKTIVSLSLFGVLAWAFGLWGAIVASALFSLISGLLSREKVNQRFPGLLRTLRPWRFA